MNRGGIYLIINELFMKRHVISYVSTGKSNLSIEDVSNLLNQVNIFNNSHDITGVLLFAETNFFQLIEGDEKVIKDLYTRIEKDLRHSDIIKFVDKPLDGIPFDGYISRFVTDASKIDPSNLENYIRHVEVLEPKSRKSVERVLQLIAG